MATSDVGFPVEAPSDVGIPAADPLNVDDIRNRSLRSDELDNIDDENNTSMEDHDGISEDEETTVTIYEKEETVVEDNGKRKRNEEEGSVEKRIGIEDAENRIVPVKKHVAYPPSTQEKMQLKRGDFVEFENDRQFIKSNNYQ